MSDAPFVWPDEMLDDRLAIVGTAGSGMSRDALATAAEMAASGGTFGTYLSRLRGNRLIVESGGTIRLVEELR